MSRFFLFLLGFLLLTACRREADELPSSGNQASEQTEQVSLSLAGDLELPTDSLPVGGRALSLQPASVAGQAVLRPTYRVGERVEAIAYATTLDGKQSSAALPLMLTVGPGGRRFSFYGDLRLPTSMVGQKLRFSVFIGFDTRTKALKAYPDKAPYYPQTGRRSDITNYPIPLQCKVDIDYHTEVQHRVKVHSYRGLNLRFRMVGSLIRCKLVNRSPETITVKALNLHGLGSLDLKLAQPKNGSTQECFVTSDHVDPSSYIRGYALPTPKTLAPGAEDGYYLVYAPLISGMDGRGVDYKGFIYPVLTSDSHMEKYLPDLTPKALPSSGTGKMLLSSLVFEERTPAIQPNAIPLQYWNQDLAYKVGGRLANVGAHSVLWVPRPPDNPDRLLEIHVSPLAGSATRPLSNPGDYYFASNEVSVADVSGLGQSLHIPTGPELEGILPYGIMRRDAAGEDSRPFYFRDQLLSLPESSESVFSQVEEIEVAGKRLVGRSHYWRVPYEGMNETTFNFLFFKGVLSPVYGPLVGLRFGRLSDEEVADYKRRGFKDSELVRDDKSRVSYVYGFYPEGLIISSCYIGENVDVKTPRDLTRRGELFSAESFAGHPIYRRIVPYGGAQYHTPNVQPNVRQLPRMYWDDGISKDTPVLVFDPTYIPQWRRDNYMWTVGVSRPPSGLLRRRSRESNELEGVWFH